MSGSQRPYAPALIVSCSEIEHRAEGIDVAIAGSDGGWLVVRGIVVVVFSSRDWGSVGVAAWRGIGPSHNLWRKSDLNDHSEDGPACPEEETNPEASCLPELLLFCVEHHEDEADPVSCKWCHESERSRDLGHGTDHSVVPEGG